MIQNKATIEAFWRELEGNRTLRQQALDRHSSPPKPFPGKSPLRFGWAIENVLHASNIASGFGKLTLKSFEAFVSRVRREFENPSDFVRVYVTIYDQAGMIGVWIFSHQDNRISLTAQRATAYLPFLWFDHFPDIARNLSQSFEYTLMRDPFRWEAVTVPDVTSPSDYIVVIQTRLRTFEAWYESKIHHE